MAASDEGKCERRILLQSGGAVERCNREAAHDLQSNFCLFHTLWEQELHSAADVLDECLIKISEYQWAAAQALEALNRQLIEKS